MLTPKELERYSRQIRLPQFGANGQEKLKKASALCIGAGALGTPVIQYLAAAGIGRLCIVDGDSVELSNLHRQVLFREEQVGQKKANIALQIAKSINPEGNYTAHSEFISNDNAFDLAEGYDYIIDGTDNFPTRYLLNDLAVLTNKTNIHGSIQQLTGQVSVFNGLRADGSRGPNYRDLYPQPPHPSEVVSCAEGGVIGALPGIIGSMMALETIKAILGWNGQLIGKIVRYDSLTHQTQILTFTKDPENPISGEHSTLKKLVDYDQFCGIQKTKTMKEISVSELKSWMDNQEDFQLIDVREEHEYAQSNLGGELIPLGQIPERFNEITKDKKVVVHCRMGGRSANAIQYLIQAQGFDNLYNLSGGITAWANEIEPSLNV